MNIKTKFKRAKFWLEQRYSHKFIFIHINKCGGTSVEKFLNLPKIHDSAQQRIEKIGIQRWRSKFSFAVVRNPYEKVISHYNYRVKTNQTGLQKKDTDLNTWIKKAYLEKDPEFYDKPLMFAPCFDWVSVDGKLMVDKFVKLENLDQEWSSICERIGVQYKPLQQLNRTNKCIGESNFPELSGESINIINSLFAKDFDTFDYVKVSRCD